jgi:hypothetical protein
MVSRESRADPGWIYSGEVQGIPLRVAGDHPGVRARVEDLVGPLVAGDRQLSNPLEFALASVDGETRRSSPSGSRTPVQFLNVSCFRDGSSLSFHTKDGSVLRADVRTGRVRGAVSEEAVKRRGVFIDLLLAPLMEMLKHRGLYGLHAAALTKDGTCYLFPGDAGSGKTTTALGLLKRGFRYLADDKVLLREEDDRITALAFTRRFNIDPGMSRVYPELGFLDEIEPLPASDKRPFDVSQVYPNVFVPSCTPRFIVHLELTGDATSRIVPLSRRVSFSRLVHQTIFSFEKAIAGKQLKLLGGLVRSTESYVLYRGKDVYEVPERVAELLPTTRGSTAPPQSIDG